MTVVKYTQSVLMLACRRWRALLTIAVAAVLLLLALLYVHHASPLVRRPQPRAAFLPPPEAAAVREVPARTPQQQEPPPAPDQPKRAGIIAGVGPAGPDGSQYDGVPDLDRAMVEGQMQQRDQEQLQRQWELQQQAMVGGRPQLAAYNTGPPYIPTRRVVHFDLKGAPPTVKYLVRLFPLIKKLGATDIMMEWEDMFPFSGVLKPGAAKNHYSHAEVQKILDEAKKHDLKVIPLVQTFGHLEMFLKLEPFAPLRELPEFPEALCPSRNESLRLVEIIIDQVMAMHTDAEFLHVGCDEVYHMGVCDLCRSRRRNDVYLQHVKHVAQYVRNKYKVVPLIWDDMLRQVPSEEMKDSGIGKLVEPMIWVYAEDVDRFAGRHVYEAFSEVFPRAWAASAYKGAFGETLIAPPLQRHLDNNLNWLAVMQRETPQFSQGFAGLVITGWQRYDHFAVLCELLPSAVPSLAMTLSAATHGFFNNSLKKPINDALRCRNNDDDFSQPFLSVEDDPEGFYQFSYCGFPGVEFFKYLGRYQRTMRDVKEFIETTTEKKGWMTEYNVARNYTNPFRVDELLEMLSNFQHAVSMSVRSVKSALKDVFDKYTIAEWVEQKIYPYVQKLDKLREQGMALKQRTVWDRRPLPMLQELSRYGLRVDEARRSSDAEEPAPGVVIGSRREEGKLLPVKKHNRMHLSRKRAKEAQRENTNGHGGPGEESDDPGLLET